MHLPATDLFTTAEHRCTRLLWRLSFRSVERSALAFVLEWLSLPYTLHDRPLQVRKARIIENWTRHVWHGDKFRYIEALIFEKYLSCWTSPLLFSFIKFSSRSLNWLPCIRVTKTEEWKMRTSRQWNTWLYKISSARRCSHVISAVAWLEQAHTHLSSSASGTSRRRWNRGGWHRRSRRRTRPARTRSTSRSLIELPQLLY